MCLTDCERLTIFTDIDSFTSERQLFKKVVKMVRAQIEVIPCKICGDKSSGVHYGVITCEGCKGFFRRSQSSSIQYSCSRQSNCSIDRASRNRCQSCRLKKCVAQGMSRDAVKFGRMSKRQKDLLFAEVERHRLQQHLQENSVQVDLPSFGSGKDTRDRSLHLIPSLSPGYSYSVETDLPGLPEMHSYLGCYIHETQAQALPYRGSTRKGYESTRSTQDALSNKPCNESDLQSFGQETSFFPHPSSVLIEDLASTIIRSHKETTQYHAEELLTLRWKMFSLDEIHAYQSKSVDEMWQYCAVRLIDAIQFVVEFAKRIPGFRQLCQNDQIALLKCGSMEVVFVRMSRVFNTENSTVLFDGKFAGTELFKSLACSDLIASVFEFAHHLCAMRLTEQQMAMFSALILINADRPCLEDRESVQRIRRNVEVSLSHILHKNNQESLLHKLNQKVPVLKSMCLLHMEKLRWFRQLYPHTIHSHFPPLYKELFGSDTDIETQSSH